MSKLAVKFLIGLSSILLVVTLFSIYLNSNFIQRYFLYQEKQDLHRISDELLSGGDPVQSVARLEAENDVIIAWVKSSSDNDLLNENLRKAFLAKGLSLGGYGNFWLWEQDRQDAVEQGRKLRIYHQEKLHYSLMIQYVSVKDDFFAVAKIIPAVERTISLINLVTACIFTAAALVMLFLVFFLVRRITTPLIGIGKTAKAIANLDFQTVKVKTGDELELLAQDINDMSGKLKTAHRALKENNRQMESLLANVSHDLKTPVSLISAYANGIKDGLDDGSFLDTILLQNEKMDRMIQRLLDLAKLQQQEPSVETVLLSDLLCEAAKQHQLQANSRGISYLCNIQPDLTLESGKDAVRTIFENLLSNAAKYASGNKILLVLQKQENIILFEIQNEVSSEVKIDIDRLWEPFYVAEESRNQNMSGTGLGLSIVRAVIQKYGYECACELADGIIRFTVIFKD